MKRIIIILLLLWGLGAVAQDGVKTWCGNVEAEFSAGIKGDASDYEYMSAGVAASYGVLLKEKYFVGLGIMPNYIFSDGDHEGFFMPVYGEFRYKFYENEKLGIRGVARAGYSPVDKRGAYAHLGCRINFKRWQLGEGFTYQHATFDEDWFGHIEHLKYNLVFATISVGYRF